MSQKAPAVLEAVSELKGLVSQITLQFPERRNALSSGMVSALQACISQLQEMCKEGSCRGLLLRSSVPGTFCAGADLKERATHKPADIIRFGDSVRGLIGSMARLPVPVVAALDGAALGGGAELALGADIRVVSSRAVMGFPETGLGIIPGVGGTQRTLRLIGAPRTKLLLFTGKRLSGQEAVDWGLADDLSDNPEEAALEILEQSLQKAPLAQTAAKAAVDDGFEVPLQKGLVFERAYYAQLFSTEDRVEALRAFAEKRPPKFQGR